MEPTTIGRIKRHRKTSEDVRWTSALNLPEHLSYPLLEILSIGELTLTVTSLHLLLSRTPSISTLSILPHIAKIYASASTHAGDVISSRRAVNAPPSIFYPASFSATAAYAKNFFAGLSRPSINTIFLYDEETPSIACPNLDFLQDVNVEWIDLPPSPDECYFSASHGVSLPQVKRLTLGAMKKSHTTIELRVRSPFSAASYLLTRIQDIMRRCHLTFPALTALSVDWDPTDVDEFHGVVAAELGLIKVDSSSHESSIPLFVSFRAPYTGQDWDLRKEWNGWFERT
jgi:hypothetical protein